MEKTKRQPNIFVIAIFFGLSLAFLFLSTKSFVSSLNNIGELTSEDGQLVGRDFIYFYAAAKDAITGKAEELYPRGLTKEITSAAIPELGNKKIDKWPFLYPPHYLLLISPFALFTYHGALAAWILFSVFLAVFAFYHCWKTGGILCLIAVLNINIFICLIMGQNAVIFASLTAIGVSYIRKNPLFSGICFAIVSMKPHFAILIPFALIFGGYIRVLLYTALSVLLLVFMSSLLFGWDIYLLAIENFSVVTSHALTNNNWFLSIYSTYRAATSMGINQYYSTIIQSTVDIISIYYLQKIWSRNCVIENKLLALSIATLLCSPYSLDYDAVWVALPSFIYLSYVIKNGKTISIPIYVLLGLQMFAFAIISINNGLSILIIISALALLSWLSKSKNEEYDSENMVMRL